MEKKIQSNVRNSKNFDLNITELGKLLPMYWLPKIHKTLVGARFMVATYYCSTNPLSDTISKTFNTIFKIVESLVNVLSFLFSHKCFVTLLVTWILNKILLYQLVLTQYHFGPTSFFISLNLSM